MPPKKNPKATEDGRAKRWCYTLNNPKQPIPWNELTQLYHVYGEEVGESGTPHYQGFVVFKNLKRLSNLKELNSVAHWEIARGTNKEASDYCKKDGQYHEFGELPPEQHVKGNAANADKWRAINDHAKAGDIAWIDENHPKVFNQSYRNLKAIKTDYMERMKDLDGVCGIWYYGESGVGKTRLVTKLYPNAYLKRMNKWFDGYQNEDVVLLDDLEPSHSFMGYELKKLADRYCYMVEVKNDSRYIRPKKVVVTSQYSIHQIWKDDQETVKALSRRFKMIHVTNDNIGMLLCAADVKKPQTPPASVPTDDESTQSEGSQSTIPNYDIDEEDATTEEEPEMSEGELERCAAMAEEFLQERARKALTESTDRLMQLRYDSTDSAEHREKLPRRLQPPNIYFPDQPPLKFSGSRVLNAENPKISLPWKKRILKRKREARGEAVPNKRSARVPVSEEGIPDSEIDIIEIE